MNLIDGKKIAGVEKEKLRREVERLHGRGIRPCLAVLLVGDDPASSIYVRMKDRAATATGILTRTIRLPGTVSQAHLLGLVDSLNRDDQVHGILVQLPLPPQLSANTVLRSINPQKDVDGLHPANVGLLAMGEPSTIPCTPRGILALLDHCQVPLKGSEAVVVGRSNLVGKPTAALLLARDATVTVCHSRTASLAEHVERADVLVAAVGRANLIKGNWIKPGAVVVDVGINRSGDGLLQGDVEFSAAQERASLITPVPGGVGPMTVAMLLANTVEAAARQAHGP